MGANTSASAPPSESAPSKVQLFELPAPMLVSIFRSLLFEEIARLVDIMLLNKTGRRIWHAQIKGILRCPDMDNRRYSKESLKWVLKIEITISNFTTRVLEEGRTELHNACEDNEAWIARVCIAFNDDDVNAPDEKGWTPLHYACQYKHVDMAKLLLESGAQPSLYHKAKDGAIPINIAIHKEDIGMVKLLLTYHEQNKELALQNFGGAICEAARVGNIEIIKLLVKSLGPGLMHLRDSYNNTALHHASNNNNAEVVELLLELGADVKSVGRNGFTPLSLAAALICLDSVKALLAAGAAVNHVDDYERTPLDLAYFVRDKNPDLVTSRLHLFDELIEVLDDVGGLRVIKLPDDDDDDDDA